MALKVSEDEIKVLENELEILFTGLYEDYKTRVEKEVSATTAIMWALYTRQLDDAKETSIAEFAAISEYTRSNNISDTPEDIAQVYTKLTSEIEESKKKYIETCKGLSEQFHAKHRIALAEVTKRLYQDYQEKIKNTQQQLRDLYKCHFLLRERKRFSQSIQNNCVRH
jgi:hypothetical protein